MNVTRALAWRCDRCRRLTVRLDTEVPPQRCDICAGPLTELRLRTTPEPPPSKEYQRGH